MRVAIFTSEFPGRVSTFFARDVRGLIDAGVDVEIFALYPRTDEYWKFVPPSLSTEVLPRNLVHHVSATAAVRDAAWWWNTWAQVPSLARVAGSAVRHGLSATAKTVYVMPKSLAWSRTFGRRFDHILAYWGNYSATCAYLFHRASRLDVPFSLFLHAGTDLYRTRVFLRQKLDYADNIFVVCQFNRQYLQRCYPAQFDRWEPKIHLHHLGLDLNELCWRPERDGNAAICAVGGLHPAKGFDDLVRALAILRDGGRRVAATIVGGGPEHARLAALIATLGLGETVKVTGWQTPDAALEVVRQSALLVHPSIGLGDAVPTVIKEAMALGTPVVASAVAGIPELLDEGRCGVLTRPRDPHGLSAAIARLLDSPEQRIGLAAAARRRAEELFDQRKNGLALAARLRASRPPVSELVPTGPSRIAQD